MNFRRFKYHSFIILAAHSGEAFLYAGSVSRIEIQRSDVTDLKFADAPVQGEEFFAKLELDDGTKVIALVRKLPNGDVLVKKHSILGENYLVAAKSVKQLKAVGEAVLSLKSRGEIRGFIVGEDANTLILESAPNTMISVPSGEIKSPQSRTDTMYLGICGNFYLVAGKFSEFMKYGTGGALEYGLQLPGVLQRFGSALVTAQYQNYSGDKIGIQYYQLYAGLRKFFPFSGDHTFFVKLTGGLNLELIRAVKLSETTFIWGMSFGWGYAYRFSVVTVFLENIFHYYYDSASPLLSGSLGLGVLYGF